MSCYHIEPFSSFANKVEEKVQRSTILKHNLYTQNECKLNTTCFHYTASQLLSFIICLVTPINGFIYNHTTHNFILHNFKHISFHHFTVKKRWILNFFWYQKHIINVHWEIFSDEKEFFVQMKRKTDRFSCKIPLNDIFNNIHMNESWWECDIFAYWILNLEKSVLNGNISSLVYFGGEKRVSGGILI